MSAPIITIPRIDVDTASRAKLVAHIDNLEFVLSEVLEGEPKFIWPLKEQFGLTHQESVILAALMSGKDTSTTRLQYIAGGAIDKISDIQVKVHMYRIRRKIKPFGVNIQTIWRFGYIIKYDDLQRLRSLLSEKAAA